MTAWVFDFRAMWREFAVRLGLRRDRARLDSLAAIRSFVAGRAAFVAQKTLYGYLRTRIGTRYPAMFEDDVFVHSVNIAKLHVFAACLSDLSIYVVALATDGVAVDEQHRRELALACFRQGLSDNNEQIVVEFDPERATQDFSDRLRKTDWQDAALHWDNFTESPRALIRWAPIAPELKRDDVEIIENSIRFTWRDIREQARRRLDAGAVAAELGLP